MASVYDTILNTWKQNAQLSEMSELSIASYMRTYKRYGDFLNEHGYDIPTVKSTMEFKLTLTDISITSLDLYLHHLNILSNFAINSQLIDTPFFNDSLKVSKRKLKAEKSKPYEHLLTESQIRDLIFAEEPKYGRKPHNWLRMRAITTMLLTSGLRNSELRNLKLSDLDFENNLLYASECKGDKERYSIFPPIAQDAVREYLKSGLRPSWVKPNDYLFGIVTRDGKYRQIERPELSQLLYNHTKSILGEDEGRRTHSMRHGCGSWLLSQNVPIEQISELFGHESVGTTSIYCERLSKKQSVSQLASTMQRTLTLEVA